MSASWSRTVSKVTYRAQVLEPDTLVMVFNVYAEVLLTKLTPKNILATRKTETETCPRSSLHP